MKCWPFMFAASKTLDYRFVIRPDCFDTHQANQFREAIQRNENDLEPRIMHLQSADGRKFSCLYRSGAAFVNGEAQTDATGRKLLVAAGVVVPGAINQAEMQGYLQVIEKLDPFLRKTLKDFLNSASDWQSIVLPSIDVPVPVRLGLGRMESPLWRRIGPKDAVIAILVCLLAFVSVLYLQMRLSNIAALFSETDHLATDDVTKKAADPSATPRQKPDSSNADRGPRSGSEQPTLGSETDAHRTLAPKSVDP